MDTQQKVFVLKTTRKRTEGLDELNTHLSRGWRVVEIAPMGGAGAGSAGDDVVVHLGAVVVVERAQRARSTVLEESEEEVDEVIEEMAEGNGAGVASEGSSAEEEPRSQTD